MSEISGTTSPMRKTVSRENHPARTPDNPATASTPADSESRPSTCTMPSSLRTSGSGFGSPVAVTRATTSVDIASATTS